MRPARVPAYRPAAVDGGPGLDKHKVKQSRHRLVALSAVALGRRGDEPRLIRLGIADHFLNVVSARDTGKFKRLEGLKVMVFPDAPAGIISGGGFWPEMRSRDDGF